ncbi:metallophosphoesterase family protein [Xinfangfangia sp. CPCC 101601]|uniref:Metallophosphoesterase family protein n=1 Tax=Pseudogemmobacter lacusdianii TaxID=3069608 RepID=A0ABU0VXM5_9RHOB|nr:metallophosphoesterase family protein [Xinfangfangia sp. CPCC 101601]MDQ2066483.1 metallophosphoesterase family protein [Xinfangfangia sp. CPCC 101601]
MRAYAVGDIHGHLDLLKEVHALIAADMAQHGAAPVVHVGDLVDRGPDSRGVIDYLMQGIAAGQDWTVLKGNHDRMFWRFLRDPAELEPGLRADLSWLHPKIGGAETLESYGLHAPGDRPIDAVHAEAVAAVPQAHRDFIENLPSIYPLGEVVFAHAGIRPETQLQDQIEDDLLWIRGVFLEYDESFGPLVIHGHTALEAATHYGNRVNIDSAAAYGGPLTAIVIEGREVWQLTPEGRKPLRRDVPAPFLKYMPPSR